MKDGDIAIMIFGDSGRAYLTKGYYDQDSDEPVKPSIGATRTSPEL